MQDTHHQKNKRSLWHSDRTDSKGIFNLQYKELKTNIFHTGKPQSVLDYLSKLYTRGDSTYSIGFGSIEITVVCNVTQYNLVEMQQLLWRSCYVHIQDRMVSHPCIGLPKEMCFITIQEPDISVFSYSLAGSLVTIWLWKVSYFIQHSQ